MLIMALQRRVLPEQIIVILNDIPEDVSEEGLMKMLSRTTIRLHRRCSFVQPEL